MLNLDSGKRDEWLFKYTAKALAEGARNQKEFRLSRVAAWTKAKEDLMIQVKETGITITESVAAGMSLYTKNSSNGPSIGIDPVFQTKLSECHSKIKAHTQAVAEYEGWIQVLDAAGSLVYDLTQADWLYFFGKV